MTESSYTENIERVRETWAKVPITAKHRKPFGCLTARGFMLSAGGRPSRFEHAGNSPEMHELLELQQLFSSRGPYPPPRDSTIPKTTLAKLKVGEELLIHADEARQERDERRRIRDAQMAERLARARVRREEAKQRQERCRAAREKEHQRKVQLVRSVRANEEMWERERQLAQDTLYENARQRVESAAGPYRSLDARLDAQEAAVDQAEREAATQERERLQKTIENMRALNLTQKRAGASISRERRSKALEKAAKQQAELKRLAADEKRTEAKAWLLARQQNESLHLSKAREFKHHVRKRRSPCVPFHACHNTEHHLCAYVVPAFAADCCLQAECRTCAGGTAAEQKICSLQRARKRYPRRTGEGTDPRKQQRARCLHLSLQVCHAEGGKGMGNL